MTLAKRKQMMLWSIISILMLSMALPLLGYLTVPELGAQEATNPRSDYWREVRQGMEGYSAVQGPEAGVLIQNSGNNWRQLRNGPLANYGGWFLAGVAGLIVLFFLVRGPVKMDAPRTGRKVQRWHVLERMMHWYVAILFIVMAITGLSLLFGRYALIPVLGKEGFANYAAYALQVHNVVGPYFTIGLVIMMLVWMVHNFPIKADFGWFLKGGGIIGKGHPSAGRMNAGEKVWYWIVFWVGLSVAITGLIMLIPLFGQTRADMQLANLIHAALGIIWIAVSLGHIYIGTIGTEGSLEGMVTGEVDEAWARQHHDLWYEEVMAEQAQRKRSVDSSLPVASGAD